MIRLSNWFDNSLSSSIQRALCREKNIVKKVGTPEDFSILNVYARNQQVCQCWCKKELK